MLPTMRYLFGPVRTNSGWEELILPTAELRLYPATVSRPIICRRVISASVVPAAASRIDRYRVGTTTPAGDCQRPS